MGQRLAKRKRNAVPRNRRVSVPVFMCRVCGYPFPQHGLGGECPVVGSDEASDLSVRALPPEAA